MTAQEIYDKIESWEERAGESFTDYFMHDNVCDKHWGEFLIAQGYKERGEAIVQVYDAYKEAVEFCCQGQDFLYHPNLHPKFYEDKGFRSHLPDYDVVYDEVEDHNERYEDDAMLWAEFIAGSDVYLKLFTEWLKAN